MGAESVECCTSTAKETEGRMITHDDRWQNWLHSAKERAAMMENAAPFGEYRPRRNRETEPEIAPPTVWLEQLFLPVDEPPNFIANWEARKAKPTTYFRSFHGKKAA
jgi:hypothetical protein